MTQFMKPQIEFGEWLLIDGACGIEAIQADLSYLPKWMKPDVDYDTDCMEEDSDLRNVLDSVEDFIESDTYDVTSVKLVEGYGARLSAPGYMDCTAWTVFKTRDEAEEFLRDEYDVEEEETEDECADADAELARSLVKIPRRDEHRPERADVCLAGRGADEVPDFPPPASRRQHAGPSG